MRARDSRGTTALISRQKGLHEGPPARMALPAHDFMTICALIAAIEDLLLMSSSTL